MRRTCAGRRGGVTVRCWGGRGDGVQTARNYSASSGPSRQVLFVPSRGVRLILTESAPTRRCARVRQDLVSIQALKGSTRGSMRPAYPEPGRGGQDQLLHGDGRHCGGRCTPHGLQRRGRCKTDLQRALRAQCRGQICQIDIVAGDCSAHRARLRSPASRLYASWFGRVRAVRGVLLRWASPRVSHQRRWGVLSQASSCRQPLLGQARRAS